MNHLQTFQRTRIPSKSKIQTDIWENVVELFENGKYKESLLRLLDYVDKDLVSHTGNTDKTEFNIPHGSVVVNIKLHNETLDVKVPFLRLPEKSAIPILRKIAEINFSPLTITNIFLEDNDLVFKYSSPLNLCEPWKMYSVFREICINADNFDDEFIQKFSATRFQEPKITDFDPQKKEEIWNNYQALLAETKEYIDYFENKRIEGFVWDALLQLFLNMDYIIAPQGALRTDLEEVVGFMQNNNYGFHEKIEKGKNFYKKLQQVTREQLDSNLYVSEVFIPIKYSASLQKVRETFTHQYETAKKEMSNSDFMGAALSIRYVFLYEFYYAYAPDDIVEKMTQALEQSSGKTWEEAARILWQAIDGIMTGNTSQSGGQQASSGWGS